MKTTLVILGMVVVAVSSAPEGNHERTEITRTPKLGLLGVNTLAQLAQDLFARSTTSSQVLSLNLTNLVILLVVKALIFGAGSLGFGGQDHLGRSIDGSSENLITTSPAFTESDLLIMLGYLKGDLNEKYTCLNFAACQDPKKAKEYVTVSNLLVKGVNILNLTSESRKYEKMLSEVQEAIDYGIKGYDCSTRYTCQDKI